MSDERVLGRAFGCIPRRALALLISVCLFVGGIANLIYLFVYTFMVRQVSPPTCRSHECLAVFTCHGMQDATYHLREVISTLVGTVVGGIGMVGSVITHDGFELQLLAGYLVLAAVIQLVCLLADWIFACECCAYSRNAIEVGLMWPIPNWPVSNMIKNEVGRMRSFPIDLVHSVVKIEVWLLCFLAVIVHMAFNLYAATLFMEMAKFIQTGPLGLGANYSLQTWKHLILEKARIKNWMRGTREMAAATWQDVDWRNEELVQGIPKEYDAWGPRPGHHSTWHAYGAAPSAYGALGANTGNDNFGAGTML